MPLEIGLYMFDFWHVVTVFRAQVVASDKTCITCHQTVWNCKYRFELHMSQIDILRQVRRLFADYAWWRKPEAYVVEVKYGLRRPERVFDLKIHSEDQVQDNYDAYQIEYDVDVHDLSLYSAIYMNPNNDEEHFLKQY